MRESAERLAGEVRFGPGPPQAGRFAGYRRRAAQGGRAALRHGPLRHGHRHGSGRGRWRGGVRFRQSCTWSGRGRHWRGRERLRRRKLRERWTGRTFFRPGTPAGAVETIAQRRAIILETDGGHRFRAAESPSAAAAPGNGQQQPAPEGPTGRFDGMTASVLHVRVPFQTWVAFDRRVIRRRAIGRVAPNLPEGDDAPSALQAVYAGITAPPPLPLRKSPAIRPLAGHVPKIG